MKITSLEFTQYYSFSLASPIPDFGIDIWKDENVYAELKESFYYWLIFR
jgi:hypothetical protein